MGQRGTSLHQLDEFSIHWIDGVYVIHDGGGDEGFCQAEIEVPDELSAIDFIQLLLDHTCTNCPSNHQHRSETNEGYDEVLFWKTGRCNLAIN